MSTECSSYTTAEKVLVGAFSCPKADSDLGAIYCCGFKDIKYCCDDPNSFFPYEHSYMWWLRSTRFVDVAIAVTSSTCHPKYGCWETVMQPGLPYPFLDGTSYFDMTVIPL
ncbi:membrane FAM159A [Pelobates cultripes]|uniref:Membrane FAM159A n=1 Tax=Pelobates cultripes TaxID=61616 RepID=A0AAD1SX80_PELCU|nr:membrane FAM159A [Pelobates cultripes]